MVLQNIIWDEIKEGTKELYCKGNNIECLKEKIVISSKGNLCTDTYMNLFDVDTWRKYTLVQRLVLKMELCGEGKVTLRTLGENIEKIEVPFSSLKKVEVTIPILCECSGKLYFEIKAESKVDFYKASYQTTDEVLQIVRIAIVICTYRREQLLKQLLQKLETVKLSLPESMEVFVVDNASELNLKDYSWVHLYHNSNTGGSGGFSRGMDEVTNHYKEFGTTNVLLMDDDVVLQQESILRLYSLLSYTKEEYIEEIVAGRMFRLDKPWIQYTAAEVWNGGDLRHIGFELNMCQKENLSAFNDNRGAEYSGWWFCCIPYGFVKDNRPLPFFLHCDDVEYGLRHGGTPIILNGIQVWHETYEYRQNAVVAYYDYRNSLFINELFHCRKSVEDILSDWKTRITKKHIEKDYVGEYLLIRALWDYSKGISWMRKVNITKLNTSLYNIKTCKFKNAIAWRYVENKIKKHY